jgi:hypothetical protein
MTASYFAETSSEKAKARRLEAKGDVRIFRQNGSRVLRVSGKNRMVNREIYLVEAAPSAVFSHSAEKPTEEAPSNAGGTGKSERLHATSPSLPSTLSNTPEGK